jgi:hypothetical protein
MSASPSCESATAPFALDGVLEDPLECVAGDVLGRCVRGYLRVASQMSDSVTRRE